jgi:hypothetical protein
MLNLERIRKTLLQFRSGAAMIQHILQLKEELRILVLNFLWCWWDARNKANAAPSYRGGCPQSAVHVFGVQSRSKNLCRSHGRDQRTERVRWVPPQSTLKNNFDGVFVKETRKRAWGFVIRGLSWSRGCPPPVWDAMQAEATA